MPNPVFQSNITSSFARYLTTGTDEFAGGTIFGVIDEDLASLCGNQNIKLYPTPDACIVTDTMYFVSLINDPEFDVKEEYYTNGFGQEKLKSRICIPRMSFSTTLETYGRGKLYDLISQNEELLIDFETTFLGYTAINFRIDEEKVILDGGIFWDITVSFLLPNILPATGITPCCLENVYSEAPYSSDCPAEPENPVLCDAMTIELNESGGNVALTITNSFGSPTSVWTFMPAGGGATISLGNNLTSVAPPGYGIVKVVVNVGACRKTASYSYLDPCTGFTVSISNSAGVLTATVDAAHTPVDSYQWSFGTDGITFATSLGTASTQVASEGAGYYKVNVGFDTCEGFAIINVTEDALCELEGEITLDGNEMTFETLSEDVVGYQWQVDTGMGSVDIIDATLAVYTATETGYYTINVELENGCIVPFNQMLIIDCSDCGGFSVAFSYDGGIIVALPSGCADPTYQWWEVNIDGSKEMLANVTDTYEPLTDGLYFSVVCCNDCSPVVNLIGVIGGDITITSSKLDDEFNWAG